MGDIAGAPVEPVEAVDEAVLERSLRELGVTAGATLLVHSSLSSMGWVEGGADAVIDALLAAVGPVGLLAMPTHTWSTVHRSQPVFHETLSPSTVGRITETFRQRPKVTRSLHPTHSVAALGPGADSFLEGHEGQDTPCARTSPYGRLVERGGQVLLIGVGLERFTLMHGFEEWAGVPWLFDRREALWVIRGDGTTLFVPSRRHTDDPVRQERDFPSLEPVLRRAGAIRYGSAGQALLRLIDARRAEEALVPLIASDPDIVLGPRPSPGVTAPDPAP
jgi:aminoglycoside 3-N-acetyltransferase